MKVKLNFTKSQEAPYTSHPILQRFFRQLRNVERYLRNLLLRRYISRKQLSTSAEDSRLVDCALSIVEAEK